MRINSKKSNHEEIKCSSLRSLAKKEKKTTKKTRYNEFIKKQM